MVGDLIYNYLGMFCWTKTSPASEERSAAIMKINLFLSQNPCYARHDKCRGTCQGTSWSRPGRGGWGGRQAGSHHLYPAQPLGLTPKLQLIILCLSVIDEFRAISTNMEVLSN